MLWRKLNLARERWVWRVTFLRTVVGDTFGLFLHFRAERRWRLWVSNPQVYKW